MVEILFPKKHPGPLFGGEKRILPLSEVDVSENYVVHYDLVDQQHAYPLQIDDDVVIEYVLYADSAPWKQDVVKINNILQKRIIWEKWRFIEEVH